MAGHRGRVGIIAAYSRTFCGTCNRLRLTAEGGLKTCLYDQGVPRRAAPCCAAEPPTQPLPRRSARPFATAPPTALRPSASARRTSSTSRAWLLLADEFFSYQSSIISYQLVKVVE
ncbi:MAG: hypothetical protein WKG07_11070 [Hymenobacter sp.]